jgi:uncharacterized repeat protein (TIGR02543 family)
MKKYLSILMIAMLTLFAACSSDDDDKTVYNVTFETDGGTPVPSVQKVEEGNTATAPATNPTKTGCVFLFWHLSESTTAYNFQTPVNGNITLYVKWQEEATAEYWQVSWELNGGTWPATDDNHATQVVKGGTLVEPNAPAKVGKVFDGWYKEAALTNKITFPYNVSAVTANITLYAKWSDPAAEYWNIAWELNGGEWPSTDDSHVDKVEKETTLVEPAAPSKAENVFDGWYKEAAFTNKVTFPATVTSDFKLYAKWTSDPRAEYFGTWRVSLDGGSWEQVSISADKIVWLNINGYGCTLSGLTWAETTNPGGSYTTDYPVGYKVTGAMIINNSYNVPKADGSGNCTVGDIACNTFYIYTGKESVRVGNFQSAGQEAVYGPYNKTQNVAYWQVTWNLNGGEWPANDNHAAQVAKDGKLAAPASPTKAGNNFGGWYKESSLINKINFPYDVSSLTGNITLYATWTDTSPSVTLNVSVSPGAGFYSSVTAMRVSSGSPSQYSIPTSAGTHTVKVSPGTYRIYYMYWACQTVNCMSSGYSSNFTVSSGQTKNISIAGSAVGM